MNPTYGLRKMSLPSDDHLMRDRSNACISPHLARGQRPKENHLKVKSFNSMEAISCGSKGDLVKTLRTIVRSQLCTKLIFTGLSRCESWINVNLKCVDTLYYSAIKALTGVRMPTVNDLCLRELGYLSLKDLVWQKQRSF